MRYRDLVPDRLGGALIASHIAIDADGPVPDYVHFHGVRLQLIHCVRGSARLVYEDQGEPFEFAEGDCVLQPPGIRHRVLESRGGLEVVEVTCPAAHDTGVDHELSLPNGRQPGRSYGGQRFVHSRAADAQWRPHGDGWLARDLGVAAATGGLADALVVRAAAAPVLLRLPERRAFALRVLLAGTMSLRRRGATNAGLGRGDALVAGPDDALELTDASPDLAWLEVAFGGA
jgi:quercetin dioxygenase-like cupin family protein